MKFNPSIIGTIGENYVMYKLATLGMRSQKLLDFIDFDLILENGLKVEVKTAILREDRDKRRNSVRDVWSFTNMKFGYVSIKGIYMKRKAQRRLRDCDYFAFVCLNKERDVLKSFIVPIEIIKDRQVISIPFKNIRKTKNSLKEFEEGWDYLTKKPLNVQYSLKNNTEEKS